MIFETHAHYDDDAFDEDRDKLLNEVNSEGVEYIVNVGASIESTKSSIALSEKYPFVYAAAGVHPNETGELTDKDMQWLKEQFENKNVIAVGEIGLDYYWDEPDRSIQKKWFESQLLIALEVNKPIIIHSRDAASDTYEILSEYMKKYNEKSKDLSPGVIHCYSYSSQMALDYVNMGFYIGVGGVLTFKNSKKLKEVVEAVPIDRIVLETDSPYLSPEPFRGKRNNSANLKYIAQKLAELKNMEYDEIISVTRKNAMELYRLGK